jgi:TPR repeat protein
MMASGAGDRKNGGENLRRQYEAQTSKCRFNIMTGFFLLGGLSGCGDDFAKAERALARKDYAKASALFQKACEKGNAKACHGLGEIVARVEGNEKKAAGLFKIACDGGESKACVSLGYMRQAGQGIEKDEKKAADLYKKACDAANAIGCRNLGVMYEYGVGAEKDDESALLYYSMACGMNEQRACELYVTLKHQRTKDG